MMDFSCYLSFVARRLFYFVQKNLSFINLHLLLINFITFIPVIDHLQSRKKVRNSTITDKSPFDVKDVIGIRYVILTAYEIHTIHSH